MTRPESETAERVAVERDLYRRLLELGEHADIEKLLDDVLGLIVQITGALRVYVELWRRHGERDLAWQMSRALTEEDLATARAQLSQTVIGEAMRRGEVVQTVSAVADPRFAEKASVRRHAIEAVVCAPIGAGSPIGVIYLQGRQGGGAFSPEAVEHARAVARHIGPYADRLLHEAQSGYADPTDPWRRRLHADELVGASPALAEAMRLIALVAPLDLTVSLTGPTGTGKTLFARVLHASSRRAEAPFLELNCASIPENLVESELFGAERGAHSTAHERVVGKIEAAGAGTLLLDEVGDLPLGVQAKLLQVLQSGRYFPLGSATERRARCRLVVASNRDLREMMSAGTFRQDLFYRLDVFRVRIPTLAERREDIVPLAEAFLARAARRMGFGELALALATARALAAKEWPGNVRELEHAVERAAVLAGADGTGVVHPRHFGLGGADDTEPAGNLTFQEATRAFQRELLVRTLREVDGNVSEAARRLDLARSYVYDLMAQHGLR